MMDKSFFKISDSSLCMDFRAFEMYQLQYANKGTLILSILIMKLSWVSLFQIKQYYHGKFKTSC